ncbi:LysR family transcriptional regulator [Robbsia andropogonis]|uniref:LysR family transcriptional regulator n=1 Tax=Robbsia andropogonis TaxID=28092 RepID=A0A0F5K019_9BURK|nr:DoxX family protein [Robbsia andropogonis]KKB62907.1 LysR family transcriptional regulator [Robbsia andropogonis]
MPNLQKLLTWFNVDLGLLFLRTSASILLLAVHGWPKIINYTSQLQLIEDPLKIGRWFSLDFAIFAEVICPILMIVGIATRLAALPILIIIVMAVAIVHPDWSLAEGQFAWMLLIIFATVAIAGPGKYALSEAVIKRQSGR